MKKFLKLLFILHIIVLSSSCISNVGEVFQTYEKDFNSKYLLKVTSYYENCFCVVGGAYYYFETIDKETNKKKEILSLRHDDPNNFPLENIAVKNENLAYFWFHSYFAVTIDGGENWSVWNADKQKEIDRFGLIKSVEINLDRNGKMLVNEITKDKLSTFITKDFGKTWEKN